MSNRFEDFINTINKINRSIQVIKNNEMREYDLKGTHVMCLYHLSKCEEGLTSAELAKLCVEDKAAISRSLSLMESKGLVHFTDIEGKKRYRTIINLTDEGKYICNKIIEKIREVIEISSEKYTEEERKIFYKVLSSIAENLSQFSNDK